MNGMAVCKNSDSHQFQRQELGSVPISPGFAVHVCSGGFARESGMRRAAPDGMKMATGKKYGVGRSRGDFRERVGHDAGSLDGMKIGEAAWRGLTAVCKNGTATNSKDGNWRQSPLCGVRMQWGIFERVGHEARAHSTG